MKSKKGQGFVCESLSFFLISYFQSASRTALILEARFE